MREHILYPLLFQIDEGTCGYQIVIQLQNHLLTAGELILVSYATSKLDSFPSLWVMKYMNWKHHMNT